MCGSGDYRPNSTSSDNSDLSKSYSSGSGSMDPGLTSGKKLKLAVKDYGSTVIVFHVAISLVSLFSFYTAVSRYIITSHTLLVWGIINIQHNYSQDEIFKALNKNIIIFSTQSDTLALGLGSWIDNLDR